MRMRNLHLILLAAGTVASLRAQDKPAAPKLEFEVATVKPSEDLSKAGGGGRIAVRIGVRNDGALVTYNRMTLAQLVQQAYGVKSYQVSGAPWTDQLQYDISAKMPDGANKDQAPEMLQNLLKDRFKLEFHRENKEHSVFALTAPKGSSKLKVADPNNAFPRPPGLGPGAPPPPPPAGGGGGQQASGGRGPGPSGPPPQGATMMTMGPNGGTMEMRGVSLARLSDMLARYVGRPVVDQTNIDGVFDFSLTVSPEEMNNMNAGMQGAMTMMRAEVASRGDAGGRGPEPPNMPDGASIFQSIQAYGLKLEPKKAPIEVIVIDSAEKSPAQN